MNSYTKGFLNKFGIKNYTVHSNGWVEIFDPTIFLKIKKEVSGNYFMPQIMCNGEKIAKGKSYKSNYQYYESGRGNGK